MLKEAAPAFIHGATVMEVLLVELVLQPAIY
jgi:hypothetical protein